MSSFKYNENRDAWGTIRGFVYQVNLTILHWLQLKDHETLELERGEDIDIVSKALLKSDEEIQRILGQVKHVDHNITLRSPEALEAVANFHEHASNNPDIQIMFRFITNAAIGVERPKVFPDNKAAIIIWGELRNKSVEEAQVHNRLQLLRSFLGLSMKPSKLKDDIWTEWIAFVKNASDEEFLNHIRNFEWSFQQGTPSSVESKIIDLLQRNNLVQNATQAEVLFMRLFLHVFKLISQSGDKRLTITELSAIANITVTTRDDEELIAKLRVIFSELERRVNILENKVDLHQLSIDVLEDKIDELKKEVDFQAKVDLIKEVPFVDIPSFESGIKRNDGITLISTQLNGATWCALYGDIGRGKTQLVAQVAKEHGGCQAWVRLRDLNSQQAVYRVETVLSLITGLEVDENRTNWYEAVCAQLPKESMIVLDDVPEMQGTGVLEESLIMLLRSCDRFGHKLVTTSNFQIPGVIKEEAQFTLIEMSAPEFTDTEIIDLLLGSNAPHLFAANSKFISALAAFTKRHPVLLIAAIRHLESVNWDFNKSVDIIFKGSYVSEVNDLIQGVILQNLEEPETRELLYRLTLVRSSFGIDHIKEVSNVEPTILRPYERIIKTVGLWMQKDTATTYILSPLLTNLGELNLEENTKSKVHHVIGALVLRKRVIHPSEAMQAIMHFVSAKSYNEAGMVLIQALELLEEHEIEKDLWGFTLIWSDQPLPGEMGYHQRLALRVKQIMVWRNMKKDVTFLINDFDRLLNEFGVQDAFVSAMRLFMGSILGLSDPIRANQYVVEGLNQIALVDDLLPEGTFDNFHPSQLVWVTGFAVSTDEQLYDWLTTLKSMSSEQLQLAIAGDLAAEGSMRICDKVLLRELEVPEAIRNWDDVLIKLNDIAVCGRDTNMQLLWVNAVRGQIIVLAEYKNDLPRALMIANEALSKLDESLSLFIIKDIMGRQFAMQKRNSEAINWLTEAVYLPINTFANERIYAHLYLASAFGESNISLCSYFTDKALEIVRNESDSDDSLLVKALGEHIISKWLEGNFIDLFMSFQEAVTLLLDANKEEERWGQLFVLFGHVSGYIVSVIKNGSPPERTRDGDHYEKPEPGMFLVERPLLSSVYKNSNDWMLAQHTASLAESLNRFEDAQKWSIRAYSVAMETGGQAGIRMLSVWVLPYLIRSRRFGDALDAALEAQTTFELLRKNQSYSANSQVVFGEKPGEAWNQVEQSALELFLIPALLYVLRVQISNPIEAAIMLEELSLICRQAEISASDPNVWVEASNAIQEIYQRKLNTRSFAKKGGEMKHYRVVQILYYFGATLVGTPKEALKAYLAVIPTLQNIFKGHDVIYNQLISPYILDFWNKTFIENKILFVSPSYIEDEFRKSAEVPVDERIDRLIEVLKIGLDENSN